MEPRDALLVVDVQNDFLPGGALPVSEGDRVVPVLNRYLALFAKRRRPIYLSRDWHPSETAHFSAYGGPWPPHCIQGTHGAAFAPQLAVPANAIVFSKGATWDAESYSAFLGRDPQDVSLAERLRQQAVARLYVGGLALDYCVKRSVLDALEHGLATTLLIDATRAVNVEPHDAEQAIEEMVRAGAELATYEHLFAAGEAV